jgi:hypothetical protein
MQCKRALFLYPVLNVCLIPLRIFASDELDYISNSSSHEVDPAIWRKISPSAHSYRSPWTRVPTYRLKAGSGSDRE